MDWRNRYRPGRFRSASFHVRRHDLTAGRRLARHEYPQRDIPYMEDTGRSAREYLVEAFVIGSDYMFARDALIDAIEQPGAGQLVHPYYGTVRVVVSDKVKITETTDEGGMARFSIPFVEAGEQHEPGSVDDTEFLLGNQFDVSLDAFRKDFCDRFSVDGVLDFVSADAMNNVTGLLNMSVFSSVMGNLSLIQADPASLLFNLLPQNLASSLHNPGLLAGGIVSLITGFKGSTSTKGIVSNNSVSSLINYDLPALPISSYTPSRERQSSNRDALVDLVVQTAATTQVTDLATSDPQTIEDAVDVIDDIVDLADKVLLKNGIGYQAADALVQLRTDALRHFKARTANLPRSISVINHVPMPAIVLAHDFYGERWNTFKRDHDIVQRNRIRHPGFVPAGRKIQLISE